MVLIYNVDIFVIVHDKQTLSLTLTIHVVLTIQVEGTCLCYYHKITLRLYWKYHTRNRNHLRIIVEFAAHLSYVLVNITNSFCSSQVSQEENIAFIDTILSLSSTRFAIDSWNTNVIQVYDKRSEKSKITEFN